MVVAVTESPAPRPFNWSFPEGRGPGIPRGQVEFQNSAVVIGAATGEARTVLISMALPQGYSYRLVDLNVDVASPTVASLEEWANLALVTMTAFNPQSPGNSLRQVWRMDAGQPAVDIDGTMPGLFGGQTDVSAFPIKTIFNGTPPTTILNAQSGTTVVTINTASGADTTVACSLGYYGRFLVYDIAEENQWAMNTPQLVV